MADAPKKKKWWQASRRIMGILTATIGGALALTPGAPVFFIIGPLAVTAPMLGLAITNIGGLLFGYGYGRKVERDKESKEAS